MIGAKARWRRRWCEVFVPCERGWNWRAASRYKDCLEEKLEKIEEAGSNRKSRACPRNLRKVQSAKRVSETGTRAKEATHLIQWFTNAFADR